MRLLIDGRGQHADAGRAGGQTAADRRDGTRGLGQLSFTNGTGTAVASRAWRAGRPCAEISDSDPDTGRLTGEAGVQYALRIRNACLVAAAFADAGITAIVTDSIINEGFDSLQQGPGGRPVNFVVLRPP